MTALSLLRCTAFTSLFLALCPRAVSFSLCSLCDFSLSLILCAPNWMTGVEGRRLQLDLKAAAFEKKVMFIVT